MKWIPAFRVLRVSGIHPGREMPGCMGPSAECALFYAGNTVLTVCTPGLPPEISSFWTSRSTKFESDIPVLEFRMMPGTHNLCSD
jgi:hypothetical protein